MRPDPVIPMACETTVPAAAPPTVPLSVLAVVPAPLAPLAPDVLPARRVARSENVVGGCEERMHHLAMVQGSPVPPLRMHRAARGPMIGPARAGSRVECLRRCGSDGFCDPSSPSGCGGEYCLAGREIV
ncbi:hypothetical protein HF313_16590 [Massilia atriviolacea]|uniref:Uncharacterized protein n=1 Tax=Massilia atriviolacea TaxID=2495579 RepID=A0A430HU41_9BURK|nr:hypothetical protein [Massilia atriviolacea]RSZ61076.1 hypothetical protein EJB06_02820 [Massilia atriviolacea]